MQFQQQVFRGDGTREETQRVDCGAAAQEPRRARHLVLPPLQQAPPARRSQRRPAAAAAGDAAGGLRAVERAAAAAERGGPAAVVLAVRAAALCDALLSSGRERGEEGVERKAPEPYPRGTPGQRMAMSRTPISICLRICDFA